MTRMKAMGCEPVSAGKDPVSLQTSTEGHAQANELRLVKIPAQLAFQRRQIKPRRNDEQIVSRKEEMEIQQDAHAKKVFDTLVREGTDPSKARQVAQAIAARDDKGGFTGRDARAHEGMVVS